MSIDDPDELAALRAAGRVVAEAIREMARRVRPGVTTAELDRETKDAISHRGKALRELAPKVAEILG